MQHLLSSHPVGPEIMSQRLFAPILHPGRALAHQGTAHPAVVSAARSSAQHDPCRMGPWERKGCPRPAPTQHPLNEATTWDFFFLGEVLEFLQKAKASPVALVPVLAGAMFGAIHHR